MVGNRDITHVVTGGRAHALHKFLAFLRARGSIFFSVSVVLNDKKLPLPQRAPGSVWLGRFPVGRL